MVCGEMREERTERNDGGREEGQEDGFQRAGGIQRFNLEQEGRGRPVESPPPLEVS